MTVPARQATPALLQIDAVLKRLSGGQAAAEIARFLAAEFPSYRWVGVYRKDGDLLRLQGEAGDGADEPREAGIGIGARGRAVSEGRSVQIAPPETPGHRPELGVPVTAPSGVVGSLVVVGATDGALDATDVRFLSAVAGKLVAPLSEGPALRLL